MGGGGRRGGRGICHQLTIVQDLLNDSNWRYRHTMCVCVWGGGGGGGEVCVCICNDVFLGTLQLQTERT